MASGSVQGRPETFGIFTGEGRRPVPVTIAFSKEDDMDAGTATEIFEISAWSNT